MAVTLTISDSIDGANVNDTLAGVANVGVDLGNVTNASYAPLTDKSLNTGARTLYLHHDGTNQITNVATFIDTFSGSYGGGASAASDYTDLKALGAASGNSKNNGDGNSGGLWIDMDADVSTTNQFDVATFPANVKIYGDNGTDGIDITSAFDLRADALVYDAPGETIPSAPVLGTIGGASQGATLGDNAKIKLRVYSPTSQTTGGIAQWDFVVRFSFTS